MNIDQKFLSEISDSVIGELVTSVVAGYRQAAGVMDSLLPNPHRKEVLPFMRAKYIDVMLHESCQSAFPTETVANDVNNWSYTKVTTPSFVITAARSDTAGGAPRHSKYRQRHAKNNEQVELFPEELEEALEQALPSGKLYAVLSHRPSGDDPSIPDYIRIVFPAADLQSVIGEGIDLLEYVQDKAVFASNEIPAFEVIEDNFESEFKLKLIKDIETESGPK